MQNSLLRHQAASRDIARATSASEISHLAEKVLNLQKLGYKPWFTINIKALHSKQKAQESSHVT